MLRQKLIEQGLHDGLVYFPFAAALPTDKVMMTAGFRNLEVCFAVSGIG